MKSLRERSILAARIAKFGPLREPIRMLLIALDQFSHIIKCLIRCSFESEVSFPSDVFVGVAIVDAKVPHFNIEKDTSFFILIISISAESYSF